MESSSLPATRVFFCLLFLSTSVSVQSDGESVIRGQVLFSKRGCRNCHAIDSAQQSIGPALNDVSEKLSLVKTVESIVHPGKEIRKGFESVVVMTVGGKIHTGRVTADESDGLWVMTSREGGR